MTTRTTQPTPEVGQTPPDQVQVTILIETLEEFSAHPDFQAGLRDAKEWFLEEYEATPLTEDEMIEKVEGNLSRRVVERDKAFCQRLGGSYSSYFYNLGLVFGTINQGLTYSYQVC